MIAVVHKMKGEIAKSNNVLLGALKAVTPHIENAARQLAIGNKQQQQQVKEMKEINYQLIDKMQSLTKALQKRGN